MSVEQKVLKVLIENGGLDNEDAKVLRLLCMGALQFCS